MSYIVLKKGRDDNNKQEQKCVGKSRKMKKIAFSIIY
jgi:hypothetical protein